MSTLDKNPQEIGKMFSSLAHRYDLANHLLSLNQDKRWRKAVVRWANPQAGQHLLDLCTGTGDLALDFAKAADIQVTGIDISDKMLAIAADKTKHIGFDHRINYDEGNVLELPYPDHQFDLATIAFGLRNLPNYEQGLREMFRVLKPGGQLLILEFSLPKGIWGKLYLWYLKNILPHIGGWITGKKDAYQYLDQSIRDFPAREDLSDLMRSIGFQDIGIRSFQGGIALIHQGLKPQ